MTTTKALRLVVWIALGATLVLAVPWLLGLAIPFGLSTDLAAKIAALLLAIAAVFGQIAQEKDRKAKDDANAQKTAQMEDRIRQLESTRQVADSAQKKEADLPDSKREVLSIVSGLLNEYEAQSFAEASAKPEESGSRGTELEAPHIPADPNAKAEPTSEGTAIRVRLLKKIVLKQQQKLGDPVGGRASDPPNT